MSEYSKEMLDRIWVKGRKAGDLDPKEYRIDVAGGLMKRRLYGNEGNLGWEGDHVYPKEKLKADKIPEDRWDDLINLRPMNAKNNVAKGEDYPHYKRAVIWDRSVPKEHKNKAVSEEEKKADEATKTTKSTKVKTLVILPPFPHRWSRYEFHPLPLQ